MSEGFDGIIPTINQGYSYPYNPESFTMADLAKTICDFSKHEQQRPNPYMIFWDELTIAYLNDDKETIERIKRKERIYKIGRFRQLISEFGVGMAKTMAWLNEKQRHVRDNKMWSVGEYGLSYKDFGGGEMESVRLYVEKEGDLFSIRLVASEDYGATKYDIVLNKNITYKSIFNQVKYFNTRLKSGVI
jgi:hypothetical protein